jgi:hypothetical protein
MFGLSDKAQWLAVMSDAQKVAFGGFFTALLHAYTKADSGNRRRIERAFVNDIEHEFDTWYKRVE